MREKVKAHQALHPKQSLNYSWVSNAELFAAPPIACWEAVRMGQVLITLQCLGIYTQYLLVHFDISKRKVNY